MFVQKSTFPNNVQVLKNISCKIRSIQCRFFGSTGQNAEVDDILKKIDTKLNKASIKEYLRDFPGVGIEDCENGQLKIDGNFTELKTIMNDPVFLSTIVKSDFQILNINIHDDLNNEDLELNEFSNFYNYFKSYKICDDDSISLRTISLSGFFESEIEIAHSFPLPKFSLLITFRDCGQHVLADGCDWLENIHVRGGACEVKNCKNLESIVVWVDPDVHVDYGGPGPPYHGYSIADCPALTKLQTNLAFTVKNCNSLERIMYRRDCYFTIINCQKFEALEALEPFELVALEAINCPALKSLDLTCDDELKVKNCVNLEVLTVETGYGYLRLSNCPQIKSLKAEYTPFVKVKDCNVENLVEDFLKMSDLEELTLEGEGLTGLPQRLFDLPPTCTIDLSGCPISHEVRQSLETMALEDGYNGPRISFSVLDDRREEQLSVEENLQIFCGIVGEEYQPLETKSLEVNEHFYSWLNRLSDIAHYKASNEHKKWVASTVLDYIRTADQDEIFRESFLATIAGATNTCGDRVALSLLKVGILHSLHQVDIKDTNELFRILTRGVWAMDLLEKCAREKVKTLPFFDEIEVYLAYPIVLKDKLGLPINQSQMLYQTCSGLEQEDFDYAENEVLQKLNDENERSNFLIEQEKWLDALKNAFPVDVQKAEEQRHIDLDQQLDYELNYNNTLKELSKKLLSGNTRKRTASDSPAGARSTKRGRFDQ